MKKPPQADVVSPVSPHSVTMPRRCCSSNWLRYSSAFVWITTGLGVLHPYYREVGDFYLARLGLPSWPMFVTCVLEVLLGIRVAWGKASTGVTAFQVVLIAGFSVILAVAEPELLGHPLGMLTKNLPLLAVIGTAWLVDREGWSRRAIWLLRGGMSIIWITEGLIPKVLWQEQMELDIVVNSGLVNGDPATFLHWLGYMQVASGIGALVLWGRPRSWLLGCQAVAVVILPLLIVLQDPLWLVHPFGPFTKNVPILVGTVILILRRD